MSASFARSEDGVRIAYELTGSGMPLVLLHGGFIQDRRSWHAEGYVERLRVDSTVITMDLRGHGESARPTGDEAYAAPRMVADVLAVLDAEHLERAAIWGYSLGASVGLQLAAASDRVSAAILGGAALGAWLTTKGAANYTAALTVAARAKERGRLDDIPAPQRAFAEKADLRVVIDYYTAMPSWPVVEPEALRCRTLFYAGSENAASLGSLEPYGARLRAAGARCAVLEGLDHEGEFHAVDRVVALCREFLLEQR
jgi:pimeloyl-ACP methyl ester carboxylesterase